MKDVFGQALYNYWKGDRRTSQIIRRDDGLVTEFSQKFFFAKKFYPTEKAVTPLIKGKILDVGCGAGRHVLHFQKRGFNITGIDISPLAIQACKERGCEKVQVMDIFQPHLPATSLWAGNGRRLKSLSKASSGIRK
ncbi:MAG: class I SAM-dependent methyltransferase [Lewinellaceae bacterium]|nr:class I SAM-dependent methyltransferase [Lewinellaceae bacterium]